jgi:uncharacterized protein YecE (DUF72 family)
VGDGGFYPKKTMTARARLAHYAERFSVAEIATTYRFPPTPELAAQLVERTPPGFLFDVRAWSLLTGSPTMPDSLWSDLWDDVRPSSRDSRRLYAGHLSSDALEECWARFAHSLEPLVKAGRLGTVILQYPGWFGPRPEAWAELARVPRRLGGMPASIELRDPRWVEGDACDETLEWLEAHGLGFVCVDGPPASGSAQLPSVVAATAQTAVVRFRGRRSVEGEPWSWPYRYSRTELEGWVPAVTELASSASEVHLIFDNTWRCDAVDGAAGLLELVGSALPADR